MKKREIFVVMNTSDIPKTIPSAACFAEKDWADQYADYLNRSRSLIARFFASMFSSGSHFVVVPLTLYEEPVKLHQVDSEAQ